jgi:hypothetical protein
MRRYGAAGAPVYPFRGRCSCRLIHPRSRRRQKPLGCDDAGADGRDLGAVAAAGAGELGVTQVRIMR